jgi:hypothetical protein
MIIGTVIAWILAPDIEPFMDFEPFDEPPEQ